MEADEASRTAVLVCQGRAVAHGRMAPGRFDDPTAMALLRDGERQPVERVRTGVPPRAFGERIEFEMIRACAEVMVPRTVKIDEAVGAQPNPQLVILGAGLDGRAWRMPGLASVDVFEVDHPASQRDKRDRVRPLQLAARSIGYVPVDFRHDELDGALGGAGHQTSTPTTWIWEGVVPYLTRAEVEDTVRVVSRRSARGSRLIVSYQAPGFSVTLGRLAARALTVVARRPDPLGHEPRRSSWTPGAMRQMLVAHGLVVTDDDDLLTLAEHISWATKQRRSLRAGRIAVASMRD
jgi:methyltransferase (TIGR00027 family)